MKNGLVWSKKVCWNDCRQKEKILSDQNIIFHQPRFPWNKGSHFPSSATFWGPRSCEVAIIWPNVIAPLEAVYSSFLNKFPWWMGVVCVHHVLSTLQQHEFGIHGKFAPKITQKQEEILNQPVLNSEKMFTLTAWHCKISYTLYTPFGAFQNKLAKWNNISTSFSLK